MGTHTGARAVKRRSFLKTTAAAGLASVAGCLVLGEETDLEGTVVMDGSNTVLPHAAAVAEEFQWRNNRVTVTVRGSGTGAGFQRFCQGETDGQSASREILEEESVRCEGNRVEHIELEVVADGIAIMRHPANDWADCLTVEELREIWRSASTVRTWQDVRNEWPDEDIVLYGRDPASGTFDSFTHAINGEIGDIRRDYSASADTNVIVRGVRGNTYALGWGGAGFFYENEDDLELVGVDAGDGCMIPTRETIETREYQPLSRGMYVYFSRRALEKPQVRALARFYFENIDQEAYEIGRNQGFVDENEVLAWTQWAARRVGFYAPTDEVIEENRTKLERTLEEWVE